MSTLWHFRLSYRSAPRMSCLSEIYVSQYKKAYDSLAELTLVERQENLRSVAYRLGFFRPSRRRSSFNLIPDHEIKWIYILGEGSNR